MAVFPSVQWFDAVRAVFNSDESFQGGGGGACNALVGALQGQRDERSRRRIIEQPVQYRQQAQVQAQCAQALEPGLRVYKGKDDLPRVMNGLGVAIVSTPKGVMTDRKARASGQAQTQFRPLRCALPAWV